MRILLTGCTGGYGRAIAEVAIYQGHTILGLARNNDQLSEMSQLGILSSYLSCDLSVSNLDNLTLISMIHEFRPQVIINNAGIGSKGNNIFKECSTALTNAFNINVIAPFELVKIATEHGTQDIHMILNISSRRGSFHDNENDTTAVSCSYTYRITKCAQNMLTTCLVGDPLLENVRIFSIHPGKLKTGLGVNDASLDPHLSAERLLGLVDHPPAVGEYFSLQEDTPSKMDW